MSLTCKIFFFYEVYKTSFLMLLFCVSALYITIAVLFLQTNKQATNNAILFFTGCKQC